MRPERCARERRPDSHEARQVFEASMRPERCARERRARAGSGGGGERASMRPERCARERVNSIEPTHGTTRFNEARAVCSGKVVDGLVNRRAAEVLQ